MDPMVICVCKVLSGQSGIAPPQNREKKNRRMGKRASRTHLVHVLRRVPDVGPGVIGIHRHAGYVLAFHALAHLEDEVVNLGDTRVDSGSRHTRSKK